MDSINGYPVPDQQVITDSINSFYNKSLQVPGLSNQSKTIDFDNMIFSFSCDFESIEALNQLGNELAKGHVDADDPNLNKVHYAYDVDAQTYTRSASYVVKKEFDKLKTVDKAIFDNAFFISIFRSENEINSQTNENARMAPTKKAIMIKVPATELLTEKQNISNTIQLKP